MFMLFVVAEHKVLFHENKIVLSIATGIISISQTFFKLTNTLTPHQTKSSDFYLTAGS